MSIEIGMGVIIGMLLCAGGWTISNMLAAIHSPMEKVNAAIKSVADNNAFTIERSTKRTIGGAPPVYKVFYYDTLVATIPFLTHTPRDYVDGVRSEDILAILIDRYECFQQGPYANPTNQVILNHLREALTQQIGYMVES